MKLVYGLASPLHKRTNAAFLEESSQPFTIVCLQLVVLIDVEVVPRYR